MNSEKITVLVGKQLLPGSVYRDIANQFGVTENQHISMAYWNQLSMGNCVYGSLLPIHTALNEHKPVHPPAPPRLPLICCPATQSALFISLPVADLLRVDPSVSQMKVSPSEFQHIQAIQTEWVSTIFDQSDKTE
jgi:hypothetical protein